MVRIAFLLLFLVTSGVPAHAVLAGESVSGPDSSGPQLILRGQDGSELLRLDLDAGLIFDGQTLRGTVRLTDAPLTTPWLAGTVSGQAEARVDGARVVLEKLELHMPAARLSPLGEANATDAPSMDLKLAGRGVWLPNTGELRLEEVRLALNREAVLLGALRWSKRAGVDASFALDVADWQRLAHALQAVLPPEAAQLDASGPLAFGLRVRGGANGALEAGVELKRAVKLKTGGQTYDLPPFKAEMSFQDGLAGQWISHGSLRFRGKVAPGALSMESPSLEYEMAMEGDVCRLRAISLHSKDGLILAGRKVPLNTLRLTGELRAPAAGGWQADTLRLTFPGGTIQGSLETDADGMARGTFFGRGLDMARLGPVLAVLAGAEGLSAEGRLDIDVTLDADDTAVRSEARLRLADAGYVSADGMQMGQGLAARVTARSSMGLETMRRWVNLDVRVDKGELLSGATYLNLNEQPLRFKANANQLGADRFKDLKAELEWTGFGNLHAHGDLWAHGAPLDWRYKGEATLDGLDLGRIFSAFVAAPMGLAAWQGENAGLAGRADMRVKLASDGTTSDLTGRLDLRDVSLRRADGGVAMSGASLELPLAYRIKGKTAPTLPVAVPATKQGTLRIGHLKTPLGEGRDLLLRMALVPNRFYVLDPIRVPLLGGRVDLDALYWTEPFSPEFELALNVAFQGLGLSRVQGGSVPLQGDLQGDLGRITVTRRAVTVPGVITGRFYGGAVRVDGLFMDHPFASRRQYGGNASVRGLELEPLSAALGVGRVTGRLDLDMEGLRVAYGQPATFRLSALTSGQGNFEKSVSLKAVNSLSVIGTGSGIGDVGVGLFASFFEEFSYSAIGFQCILNNDRFQVRGLIREGGVEYLIKKPFLTGINVVNGNPDNYISFSDMLERVQRVVKDQKSSQTAPVAP